MGSVANKYLGKVTEAFQKFPSSFGTVVRKPGLGGKLPPLATQGLTRVFKVVAVIIRTRGSIQFETEEKLRL